MAAIKRKKLYFFVDLAAVTQAVARCTQGFRAGVQSTYAGDAYGGVLEDLPALTAGSAGARKARNEVTAWFVPHSGGPLAATSRAPFVITEFVQWTSSASGASVLANGGGVAGPDGSSPIYTRQFGVRVRRGATAPTVKGVLYVQRRHSIEV